MKSLVLVFLGFMLLSVFLFVEWTKALSKNISMTEENKKIYTDSLEQALFAFNSYEQIYQYMKKTVAYIPLESDEIPLEVSKTTPVIEINKEWFKLAEVWVPGLAIGTDLWNKTHFRSNTQGGIICVNCNKPNGNHKGPDKQCPDKN